MILRLFRQWRVEPWGKWRPSAKARALGETAIALERLLSRDGFSFPEAVKVLTQRHPQYTSVEELEAIYVRLPLRKPRPVLLSDENVLAELPSEDSAEERARRVYGRPSSGFMRRRIAQHDLLSAPAASPLR